MSINRSALNLGLMASITALFSCHIAYYLLSQNITVVVWATLFGIFLAFYRFGNSKKEHIFYVTLYAFITWIVLLIFSVISVLSEPYYRRC